MRALRISLALLSGLLSVAAGIGDDNMVAIDPDEIPLGCVIVCGPVVELADICHVGTHANKLRRRDTQSNDGNQARNVLGLPIIVPIIPVVQTPQLHPQTISSQLRTTSTPRVIPTTKPATTLLPSPIRTAVRQNPTSIPQPLTRAILPTPAPDDTLANMEDNPVAGPQVNLPPPKAVGNAAWADDVSEMTMNVNMPQQKANEVEKAEQQCVCSNTSFNVALVAGLCSSCVQQAGLSIDNLNTIMRKCNFSVVEFSRARETAARNVRVQATAPTISGISGTSRFGPNSLFAVIGIIAALM